MSSDPGSQRPGEFLVLVVIILYLPYVGAGGQGLGNDPPAPNPQPLIPSPHADLQAVEGAAADHLRWNDLAGALSGQQGL